MKETAYYRQLVWYIVNDVKDLRVNAYFYAALDGAEEDLSNGILEAYISRSYIGSGSRESIHGGGVLFGHYMYYAYKLGKIFCCSGDDIWAH